jgi:hypothetical protein
MRPFETNDIDELNGWLKAHGQNTVTPEMLPGIGVIVPGVAAGFLYRTDSSVGMIHCLTSNPTATSAQRHEALDAVVEALLAASRHVGVKHLLCFSSDSSVIARSARHGFDRHPEPHIVITQEIAPCPQ